MWAHKSDKTSCMWKKYIWYPNTWNCENGKYLERITDNSVITCDEIIELARTVPTKNIPTKTISKKFVPTSFNKNKKTAKQNISIFYSIFY